MKIVSHKNCADGVAAAAVVDYWARKQKGEQDIKHIPMLYTDTFPIEDVQPGEPIVIVDFSLQVEDMEALLKVTKNVVWIDHHRSAIEKYDNMPGKDDIKGIRSNDRSGAYLAWQFFFDKPVPRALELVSDHDLWTHAFEESDAFRQGMLLVSNSDPTNPLVWDPLFEEGSEDDVNQIIDVGNILESNADRHRRNAVGYTIEFEGLTFLVMNKLGNSNLFKYIDDGTCEGLLTWQFTGKEYIYTMYHSKRGAREKIDLSEIAVKWGGGGHAGSCGYHSQHFIAHPDDKRTTLEEFDA